MKKRFFLFFLMLILYPAHANNVTFMWWNVQNYFDAIDDPDKDDIILSEELFFKKTEKLAKVLLKDQTGLLH